MRRLLFFPADLLDKVLGRRDPLIPPRWMVFVGSCNFADEELLRYFTELGGLKPMTGSSMSAAGSAVWPFR
jgi:hypothetical protein